MLPFQINESMPSGPFVHTLQQRRLDLMLKNPYLNTHDRRPVG